MIKNTLKMLLISTFITVLMTGCQENCCIDTDGLKINRGNKMELSFVNVSTSMQGDCTLITQNNRNYLIDAGEYQISQNTLIPFLKLRGVSRLDKIFISYPHKDHFGGVAAILEDDYFEVGEIYINQVSKEKLLMDDNNTNYSQLLEIYNFENIIKMETGDIIRLDEDSWIDILYAYQDQNNEDNATTINDESVVMMLNKNRNRVLFTGDLGDKSAKEILSLDIDIRANILKLPHHGAEPYASNAFLDKVDASLYVLTINPQFWNSNDLKHIKRLRRMKTYLKGKDFLNIGLIGTQSFFLE